MLPDARMQYIMRESGLDEDGNGEIEFNEFLAIMNSTKLRQMQAVDNREGRLRRAFSKIEGPDGRIRREDLVKLLTVSTTVYIH